MTCCTMEEMVCVTYVEDQLLLLPLLCNQHTRIVSHGGK